MRATNSPLASGGIVQHFFRPESAISAWVAAGEMAIGVH